jgi:hypothetical protein
MKRENREVPIGEVIAEREYLFHHDDGTERTAVLRIGKPTLPAWSDPTHPPFVCPFELVGFPKEERMYAAGIDAVQALVLAFRVLPSWLLITASVHRGRFSYLESSDLGLPEFVREPPENEGG